jgi:hypothetical protein
LEATVFREQMISVLEPDVVFMLATSVLSIAATSCTIRLLNGFSDAKHGQGIIERKLSAASNRLVASAILVNPVARPPIFLALMKAWRELRKGFLDSYRPELHYMRGPGPKWREKDGAPRLGAVARTRRRCTLEAHLESDRRVHLRPAGPSDAAGRRHSDGPRAPAMAACAMSMHIVTKRLNKVLGERGRCVQASMNYVDGGLRERFRFTINHKGGQSAIDVEVPTMTSLDDIERGAIEQLCVQAPCPLPEPLRYPAIQPTH